MLGEIASGLGITDQALYNLRNRYPDTFPEPVRTFGTASIYWRPEVEDFHRQHGYGYGSDIKPIGAPLPDDIQAVRRKGRAKARRS